MHPASCSVGTGVFSRGEAGALPRFRISGAVRPLSLYALVWIETAFIVKVLTVSASETLTNLLKDGCKMVV